MFEVNEKMKIQVVTGIKGRSVVIIDDFYKDPDAVRELALATKTTAECGSFPGTRGVYDDRVGSEFNLSKYATTEVTERLFEVYLKLCKTYFNEFDEEKFNKNWLDQMFMFNSMNDETLKANPEGIIPHQDTYANDPSPFQFGSVVYLNTEDECAGGTKIYSHYGRITIPEDVAPSWIDPEELSFHQRDNYLEHIHGHIAVGDNGSNVGNPYKTEYKIKMKYNRMALYEADVMHGQDVYKGMFDEYNRINQVLFM